MRKLKIGCFILMFLLSSVCFPISMKAKDTSWYSDSVSLFMLTTAEQFLGLGSLVNSGNTFKGKCIKLGNDIDLSSVSWKELTIIGTSNYPFEGVFDGCNHTITYNFNMNGYSYLGSNTKIGLFGYINSNAEITRLKVTGSIKNVRFDSSSSGNYIGGIVGYSSGTVSHCSSNMEITYSNRSSAQYIGGICGYNIGNIISCLNSGNISADYTSYGTNYIGGIVGYCTPNSSCINCLNEGIVNATNSNSGSGLSVGGICGYCLSKNILYCENVSSVYAYSPSAFAGGIAGYSESAAFSYCRNTGTISSRGIYTNILRPLLQC